MIQTPGAWKPWGSEKKDTCPRLDRNGGVTPSGKPCPLEYLPETAGVNLAPIMHPAGKMGMGRLKFVYYFKLLITITGSLPELKDLKDLFEAFEV